MKGSRLKGLMWLLRHATAASKFSVSALFLSITELVAYAKLLY
ncbi:hypothetical protein [Nitrosomonas sp.]|nr:hypothetical protein [Nitrosomonas sp.]